MDDMYNNSHANRTRVVYAIHLLGDTDTTLATTSNIYVLPWSSIAIDPSLRESILRRPWNKLALSILLSSGRKWPDQRIILRISLIDFFHLFEFTYRDTSARARLLYWYLINTSLSNILVRRFPLYFQSVCIQELILCDYFYVGEFFLACAVDVIIFAVLL